ncbi:MAG: NAD(P)/FAD-dependent oxidoreductase [Candidatus Hodarchaeota archaeon]
MRILVIGYGPGGAAAATTAKTFEPKSEITIFTEETIPAHRKPGASMALEHPDTKELRIPDWSIENLSRRNIQVLTGTTVLGGDLTKRELEVRGSSGKIKSYQFDKLIIATGGIPSVPSIPGTNLPGVYTIQTMADTSALGTVLSSIDSVIIVGAGFSGLETAERLYNMGKEVHLVIRSRLMRRQLEEPMSEDLLSRIPKGIQCHVGTAPSEVLGTKKATGVKLGDKDLLGGAVIFMTGVRPSVELAKNLGVKTGDLGGIQVNQKMETNVKGVYAVGDCVEMLDALTNSPILMPVGSTAARAGRQAGIAAIGRDKIYNDTSLRLQYDRIFQTDIVCVGHSSVTADDLGIKTQVHFLDDPHEGMKVALVTDKEDRLIGGQVLSARMGARVGYEIIERVEQGNTLKDSPLLESRHGRIRNLLEKTLGPIR